MQTQGSDPLPDRPALETTDLRRWSIVVLLFLASLINYFDRATVSFALPDIARDLGLDAWGKGVLISAFFWSYALMQIPMGVLSDRVNLRWLYAGAFALWSLAQGLTGFAQSLGLLIFFRIILGIGEAIYLPGGNKVVSLYFRLSERGLPCGLFDAGTRSGLVLEGLLVPFLVQTYGWRRAFAIVGFTALLWLVPWLALTPRQLRVPLSAQRAAVQPSRREVLTRSRNLFGMCLGFFCFDYYWYLLLQWLPDYLQTVRKFTILEAGFLSSVPFLIFALCQPIGGWIADRLVRAGWNETRVRKGMVSIAFTTGLLLIPAAMSENATLAVGFLMGCCLVGLSTANMLVILQSCAPPAEIGLWIGIYNLVGNIAGALAPLVTGYLIKTTGSYTPAFVLAGVLIAAGQLAYWFVVGDIRDPRGEAASSEAQVPAGA